jgi:hypothetical protein
MISETAKSFERQIYSFKWRYSRPKESSKELFIAHLLVVKNSKYSGLARVCIESFLFHHPKCSIIVHCDYFTYSHTQMILRKIVKRGSVKVILDQVDDQMTWQDQKIQLLISLNGTSDIFMDADLRWNGSIPIRKGLTFFVDEFAMQQKSPFKEMLSLSEFANFSNPIMRNTSFFTFSGTEINDSLIEDIFRIHSLILDVVESDSVALLDRSDISRISEQLAISLAVEKWGMSIYALKVSDGHRDGKFVESSYYGATGVSF